MKPLISSFLVQKWFSSWRRKRPASARRPARRCSLRVEALEDRTVPAGLIVDDVPNGVVHQILLNPASPAAVQTGTFDFVGDVDVYRVTFPVSGQATIVLDGGEIPEQTATFLVRQGQSIDLSIFAEGEAVGPYKLTINTIADDFPDFETTAVALHPTTGAGSQSGRIHYADDADYFWFTSRVDGIMTLAMRTPHYSALRSTLAVSSAAGPVAFTNDFFVSKGFLAADAGRDHVVQFQVAPGQTYTVKAFGFGGSVGDYQLLFSVPTDPPGPIDLGEVDAATQAGSIGVPNDQDVYTFTAAGSGWMVIHLQGNTTSFRPKVSLQSVDGGPPAPATTLFQETRLNGTGTAVPPDSGALADWTEDLLVIEVVAGQTFQLLVEGDGGTIGNYQLLLSSHSAASPNHELHGSYSVGNESGNWQLTIVFDAADGPQFIALLVKNGADGPPPPTITAPTFPTAARLAISASPPAPENVPSGASSAGSAQLGNALVSGLLRVAARDNAVQSIAGGQRDLGAALVPVLLGLVTATVGGPLAADDADLVGEQFLVGGKVFEDDSGKGSLEADDVGIAGEKVVLEAKQGDQFILVGETTTNAEGDYSFQIDKPGTYRVRLIPRQGAGATLSTPASYDLILHQASERQSRHFGKQLNRRGAAAPAATPAQPAELQDDAAGRTNSVGGSCDRVFEQWDQHCAQSVEVDGAESSIWLAAGAFAGWAMLPIPRVPTPRRPPRRKPTGSA